MSESKLCSLIDSYILEYNFLDIDKSKVYSYIKDILKSLNTDNDLNIFDVVKSSVTTYYDNIISERLEDSSKCEELVITYVNHLFKDESSSDNVLELLNKLGLFFDKYNYNISTNTVLNLLASNINLYNGIQHILNEQSDKLQNLNYNSNSLLIVKAYCDLNKQAEDLKTNEEAELLITTEDNLKLYFNDVNKRKLLTPDEERYLIYKVKNGDIYAKDEFLESNLRLVVSVARDYLGKGIEFLDLIQEGNVGLILALERFDPGMGCKFSTYATPWIRREIIRFIMSKNKNINNIISLNYLNPVDNKSLEDKLHDAEWTLEEEIEERDLKNIFYDILHDDILTEQEKEFIELKYGFHSEKPLTLEQIGNMNNISRQRVKQVLEKAIRKIKKSEYMETLRLYDYHREPKPVQIKPKTSSLYGFLHGYSRNEVDEVLKGLEENELNLIRTRYGEGSKYLNNEDSNSLYCEVVPKIKRLLKEQRG